MKASESISSQIEFARGEQVTYVGSVDSYRGQTMTVLGDCTDRCAHVWIGQRQVCRLRLLAGDGQLFQHVRATSVQSLGTVWSATRVAEVVRNARSTKPM